MDVRDNSSPPLTKTLYHNIELSREPLHIPVMSESWAQSQILHFQKLRGDTMTQPIYTIGQIAECLECKEKTARMLLNVAGANPKLNVYNHNTNETVTQQTILDLASLRSNGRIGRRLSRLLATWPNES